MSIFGNFIFALNARTFSGNRSKHLFVELLRQTLEEDFFHQDNHHLKLQVKRRCDRRGCFSILTNCEVVRKQDFRFFFSHFQFISISAAHNPFHSTLNYVQKISATRHFFFFFFNAFLDVGLIPMKPLSSSGDNSLGKVRSCCEDDHEPL